MKIDIGKFVSYSLLLNSPEEVMALVELKGEVIIVKNDVPLYVINSLNREAEKEISIDPTLEVGKVITLHEAMVKILESAENNQMHAAELAESIYENRLYFKKDGTKADYVQIRARAGRYKEFFETLPGNMIKLKKN